MEYTVKYNEGNFEVDINGEDTGFLIGYRGEVLNAVQAIISNIASKETKLKVLVNIGGYREKREGTLQNVAKKIADKLKKGRQKAAADKNQKVAIMSRYISILAVGLQKDMNSFMRYTVYQLFDEFKRYELKRYNRKNRFIIKRK